MSLSRSFALKHREVWNIAGPMIFSNLSIPLLGLVDTAVVGHLKEPFYLGAVAVGSLIFNFIYWGFGFLRMGTTGITAQAFGNKDQGEVYATFFRALLIAILLAFSILILQSPIAFAGFWLIDGSTEVEQYAGEYFFLRIWSAPATLMNYVVLGWFLGMQNARIPLILLVAMNALNIVLDLIFVVMLHMDVAGVALASVIAEYFGLILGMFFIQLEIKQSHSPEWRNRIIDKQKLKNMLLINNNIFIRTLCLIFAFAFFTAQGAQFGDIILAANALLLNFQMFMAYGLDGFAHAAEALVGKAIGSKHEGAFRTATKSCAFWSLLVAIGFVILYALSGQIIVNLLTDINSVRLTANAYLFWVVALPVISVWGFLFDGIFIGATRSVEMRNTMLFSLLVCFLPAWYFLKPLGNHGLWLAFMIFMAARGISQAWVFRRIKRQNGFISCH